MAARGARAAAGDAGDRISRRSVAGDRCPASMAAFRQGLEGSRLSSRAATWRSNTAGRKANTIGCRRWRPIWSAGRSRSSCDRRHRCGAGGQGGDRDHPDRLQCRRRSGRARSRRQPRPAGRQRHRRDLPPGRAGGEAARTAARAGSRARRVSRCWSIPAIPTSEAQIERRGGSASAHRAADRRRPRQRQPRDRRRLRGAGPQRRRRARRRHRPVLLQPARPARHAWRRAMRFPRSTRCANTPRPAA